MKRRRKRHLTLMDAIEAVQSITRNDGKTTLVIADMLNRGIIKVAGRNIRVD